jgi:hypothetical protein
VTDKAFVDKLRNEGCGLIIYVEYVPAEENTEKWLLTPQALKTLNANVRLCE